MDISKFALKNKTLIITALICLIIGGGFAYNKMSKLEDPEIKVKVAVVLAVYPGADAYETELQVTEPLEKAIKSMSSVDKIESISYNDMAVIRVDLKTTIPDDNTQQEWDMLRRKVNDAKASLPASVQTQVMDDYGDVYGIFYAVTYDGYDHEEAAKYTDKVAREIEKIDGISKIVTYGERQKCVNIEMATDKMANLGIHPSEVLLTLNSQSSMVYSGYFTSGDRRIKIGVDDSYTSIDDIGNVLIKGHEKDQLKLSDISEISFGYETPVRMSMKFDGEDAIGLLIAADPEADIIKVGKKVDKRLDQLQKNDLPAGIKFNKVFFQPDLVSKSIDTFIVNLIGSILIVIILLMFTMGFRSGIIIAVSLVTIVFGSFVVLEMFDGTLQRVSLGSLIVAMGMLVDNAIVITDGILVDMKKGVPAPDCYTNIGKKTAMPLLGATIIAILAFFPIFMSPDMAGSYVRDLFIVLAVSLLLSWILALTHVPIHAAYSLKPPKKSKHEGKDMFDTPIYRFSRKILDWVLSHRVVTIGISVMLVLISAYCFKFLPQMFFPDMEYNQVYVEYKLPEGYSNEKVEKDLAEIEDYLRAEDPNINHITTSLGGTPGRYCLVRAIANPSMSYGELIIDYEDYDKMVESLPKMQKDLMEAYPEAYVRVKQYNLMYRPYPIEVAFTGPDPAVLKDLSAQAEAIMEESDATWLVTNDWSPLGPTLTFDYNQALGREAGITRSDASMSILAASEGIPCGTFQDGSDKMNIYIRSTDYKGDPVEYLSNAPAWGMIPSLNGLGMETLQGIQIGAVDEKDILSTVLASTPLSQVTNGINIDWEDQIICRSNLERCIKAQCNNTSEYTAAQARDAIKDKIESIELPEGYSMEWQGEYNASQESTRYLFAYFPVSIVIMILILIALFKDVKKPLIIILCLPLVAIGIVFGILVSGMSFGFVAIVGCLGIIGMMIKNGIVLIDEIDREIKTGMDPYKALVESTLSRLRPVMMASLTTVLGMIPLLRDPLFGTLAVTIMGGLTMGTLITLVFLPVLYSIFFKIKRS